MATEKKVALISGGACIMADGGCMVGCGSASK